MFLSIDETASHKNEALVTHGVRLESRQNPLVVLCEGYKQ